MFKFTWPFNTPILPVSGAFGRLGPFDYIIKNGIRTPFPHNGTDYPTKLGTEIRCTGIVTEARETTDGYGRYVRVKLSNGYIIGFAHIADYTVRMGQIVNNQVIGHTGQAGNVSAPCCHVELHDPKGVLVDAAKTIEWTIGGETNMIDPQDRPHGSVFKYSDSPDVYFKVPSGDVFTKNFGDFGQVVDIGPNPVPILNAEIEALKKQNPKEIDGASVSKVILK